MMRRTVWVMGVVVALVAPAAASALDLQVEGFYGIERPPSTDFRSAVSGANAPGLFDSSLQLAGGDLLLNLGGLELGAIADATFGHNTASQTAIGALAGLGLGLGSAKLDLLAEAGGHRYGNFVSHPEIVTASSSDEWLFYVGLRPGISFKFAGPLSIGLWAFVRWDVNSQNVPVTVGSAGNAGSYKLGGTTIGATVRIGFDL